MVLIIFVTALVGIFVNFWDILYYPNYFFSHTGLIPDRITLITSLIFSACIFVIIRRKNTPPGLLIILSLIIFFGAAQTIGHAGGILAKTVFRNPVSPDEQLAQIYGTKYRFIKWVAASVSKTDRVVIPPQITPWIHTGGYSLMQSWLYPTTVVSPSPQITSGPKDFSDYNYILISSESYAGIQRTWPDFPISALKIIIYDWEENTGIVYEGRDYNPQEWRDQEPWGLIVPRKL